MLLLLLVYVISAGRCASSDLFGLSSSNSFTLNDLSLPQVQLIDSLALSNDACIRYSDHNDRTGSAYNIYTGMTNPAVGVVCASHNGLTLSWQSSSGFVLNTGQTFDQDGLHYGSMIAHSGVAYLLYSSSELLAMPASGVAQFVLTNTSDPLLGLFSDTQSGIAYLALDTAREQFYIGYPLEPDRQRDYIAGSESIFIGGNLLNSRPQILKSSLRIVAPPDQSEVSLESGLVFPLLSRETLRVSASQVLQQPVFTVPVIVGSSVQLNPYLQTHFQDLQIEPGAVLVLDLGGTAYDTGDTLGIFTYAAAQGQFEQIVLLNYASSSCLVLSADGQFTGTSFYITFTADLSCTYSAAVRLLKEFYYY